MQLQLRPLNDDRSHVHYDNTQDDPDEYERYRIILE